MEAFLIEIKKQHDTNTMNKGNEFGKVGGTMKLKSILRNNKDLKKNGYKMLRKLRKMEKRKGADKAYSVSFGDTYGFVLYCQALVEIIKKEYHETDLYIVKFEKKCSRFLEYLNSKAKTQSKIKKSYLASFLKSYTKFFNKVIDKKYKFSFDQIIREIWNNKCLMAYIATWGK